MDLYNANFYVLITLEHMIFKICVPMMGTPIQSLTLWPFSSATGAVSRSTRSAKQAALSPVSDRGITILLYLDDSFLYTPPRSKPFETLHVCPTQANYGLVVHSYTKTAHKIHRRKASFIATASQLDTPTCASRIPLGCFEWYYFLLRMLGLLTAAAVLLGFLELRNFQKWFISLHLNTKHHRHRYVLVLVKGAQTNMLATKGFPIHQHRSTVVWCPIADIRLPHWL